MRIQEDPFHCLKCGHVWLAEIVVDAPVEVALASIRAVSCPSCGAGSKDVAFGRGNAPLEPIDSSGMDDMTRRSEWLKMHDNGASSECIANVMCGLPFDGSYPLDGADFGRCERLLTLYPEWRARLSQMVLVNVQWAALVERWDEIATAWRHDAELAKTDRSGRREDYLCYPLMRSILYRTGR